MIELWLGLFALLQSTTRLFEPSMPAILPWLQCLLAAVLASLLLRAAQKLRRIPLFGVRGQWLIIASVLALLLLEGGLPGEARSLAHLLELDEGTREILSFLAQLGLVGGLWHALSHLANSRHSLRVIEESMHDAVTEMVLPPTPRPRHRGPRDTGRGLTRGLQEALEHVGEAHRALRNKVLQEPGNIAARLALHHRLHADPTQKQACIQHAQDFISALRHAERQDVALGVAAECAQLDKAYFPQPEDAVDLAHHALVMKRPALALRLLRQFDMRHNGHPLVPRALLESASARGHLGHLEKAQHLLGALVERFPDDTLAADAIALSARLAVGKR